MTEKFTYMDFLMYVLPGAVLLWALLLGWWFAGLPLPMLQGDGGLFQSVVFVVTCFLLGHFVQVVAHSLPEGLLKRLFWGGRYPSETMFFKGQRTLSRRERDAFLANALQDSLMQPAEAAPFAGVVTTGWFRRQIAGVSAAEFDVGIGTAQHVFNLKRVHVEERGLGTRARGAESYYQFYRGSMTASGLAAGLFGILLAWAHRSGHQAPSGAHQVLVASITVSAVLLVAFGWRARGAAQAFAREVCRAYDFARRHPAATGSGAAGPVGTT